MYLEVSINGFVTLSLVDDTFQCGRCGFYAESATLKLDWVRVQTLRPPSAAEAHGPLYTSSVMPEDTPPPHHQPSHGLT
jgi:beta-fructofuranosidase